MSGKHYGKGKQAPRSKKGKAKLRAMMRAPQPAAPDVTTPRVETATPVEKPAAGIPVSPLMVKPEAARYPYISVELQRIGILGGIIIVILIVLSVVIP